MTVYLISLVPYFHTASGILNVQIPDSFIQVFPRQPVVGVDVRLECFAYGRLVHVTIKLDSYKMIYNFNVLLFKVLFFLKTSVFREKILSFHYIERRKCTLQMLISPFPLLFTKAIFVQFRLGFLFNLKSAAGFLDSQG